MILDVLFSFQRTSLSLLFLRLYYLTTLIRFLSNTFLKCFFFLVEFLLLFLLLSYNITLVVFCQTFILTFV